MLNQIKTLLESDKRIKHWTVFDQHRNGHQIYTSLGQQEAIRAVEQMMGSGQTSPDEAADAGNKVPVRRSIATARDLPKGAVLSFADLAWLRPGSGFAPGTEAQVVGMRLNVAIPAGTHLLPEHLTPGSE